MNLEQKLFDKVDSIYERKFSVLRWSITFGVIIYFVLPSVAFSQKEEWISKLLQNNVVRIRTTISDGVLEEGFGFIVAETPDSLYIATAKHVVWRESNKFNSVDLEISFQPKWCHSRQAEVQRTHPTLDLALVRVAKPEGYVWEYLFGMELAREGEKVWIIGNDGDWDSTTKGLLGRIEKIKGPIITAEFGGAQRGASGGPLISNRGITGLITDDEGAEIKAITIDAVKEIVLSQWMNVDSTARPALPYFAVGCVVGAGMALSDKASQHYRDTPGLGQLLYGVTLEMFFDRYVFLRLSGSTFGIESSTVSVNGQDFRFRNRYFIIDGSFVYHFRPVRIVESPLLSEVIPPGAYVFGGVTYLRLHPELKQGSADWQSLSDRDDVAYRYSSDSAGLHIGVGVSGVFSPIKFGFEIKAGYVANEYLIIDLDEYYKEDIHNDWYLTFSVNFSYIIRSGRSSTVVSR